MLRRFGRRTGGQSLVETALALPILLLLVLGIADLGRYGYYAITVSHAAQDAAAYAAKQVGFTGETVPAEVWADVRSRVCDELGIDSSECAGAFSGDCTEPRHCLQVTREGANTTVRVVYRFTLITGLIADRMGVGHLAMTADATYAGYTQ